MNYLAALLVRKAEYPEAKEVREAEDLCTAALIIRRKLLGDSSSDVAASLHTLAEIKYRQGDLSSAESLLQDVLTRYRRLYGGENPRLIRVFHELAMCRHQLEDDKGAVEAYRQEIAIRRKVWGDEDPETLMQLLLLSDYVWARKDRPVIGACLKSIMEDVLTVAGKQFGNDYPEIADWYMWMGEEQATQGDVAGAEESYRAALHIRSGKLPAGHEKLAASQLAVARILITRGRFAEAEHLLLDAYKSQTGPQPASSDSVGKLLQGLGDLHEAWHAVAPEEGHDARAREWRAKRAEWELSTQPSPTPPS
jgi:tetratricopeptide (TPR) repeat protein